METLFLIVSFARIYKTVTCDTICTADDQVKIACKEGASKGDNIYTKILRKFIWLVYVFKNSVLVFICKLANQRRQRPTCSQILQTKQKQTKFFINTHKLQRVQKLQNTDEFTRSEYRPPAITIKELD